ncbi:PH domain-containing protein [Chitinophaga varians]|uniref:PH domain-containing protein n=1 Tax=Chitinophaga varians TaxID=2202339 RepID=A0A847R7D4_9BACT|nr:PH domain-containing protein [Chitinophaga varians]NLR63019.1 PH domain-containing protein [Chitinophaga varians]
MQETFTLPDWYRNLCYAGAVFMVCMGVFIGYIEFSQHKRDSLIFMSLAFFFLAWSMYAYPRLKLTLSPQEVSYTGGFRPHHFQWTDITDVDLKRVGRYREVQLIIRYGDRKLRLDREFFRKEPFLEILDRVERYAPPGVFTAGYHRIKTEILL